MTKKNPILRPQMRKLVILIVLAIASTLVFCTICRTELISFLKASSYSLAIWTLLWVGNSLISRWIDFKISWLNNPVLRLIIGVLSTIIYSGLVVFLLQVVFYTLNNYEITYESVKNNIIISLIITFIIALFLHAKAFFQNWRKLEIDAEKLKHESLSAKYQVLRNQINPHFLFNSFNSLTDLIYTNQDQAAEFVKELSNVYRYVLETKEHDLVPIAKEIALADSYLFLERIRYGEN